MISFIVLKDGTVGYNDFDFLGQNRAYQTGERCEIGFWDTFRKYDFPLLLSCLVRFLALQLAKIANRSQKIFGQKK